MGACSAAEGGGGLAGSGPGRISKKIRRSGSAIRFGDPVPDLGHRPFML